MRKFTQLMLTLALLVVGVGVVKSQDYQIYQRKTSVANGDVIAIVNEHDGTGKAFYSTGDNGVNGENRTYGVNGVKKSPQTPQTPSTPQTATLIKD